MKTTIHVVDYGLGNLHSVCNALKAMEIPFAVTDSPSALENAKAVILPGVGAFEDGMRGLVERRLDVALKNYVKNPDNYIMGICLGAQLLLEESCEFGHTKGLGIIPGTVEPLAAGTEKIPHVGWKAIDVADTHKGDRLFEDGSWMFFVHSFHMIPADPMHVLATTAHGRTRIAAALSFKNVFCCQFHPEKSGPKGLQILSRFANL